VTSINLCLNNQEIFSSPSNVLTVGGSVFRLNHFHAPADMPANASPINLIFFNKSAKSSSGIKKAAFEGSLNLNILKESIFVSAVIIPATGFESST
jgi:hypothetical protein